MKIKQVNNGVEYDNNTGEYGNISRVRMGSDI